MRYAILVWLNLCLLFPLISHGGEKESIEAAIKFLQREVPAWRKENGCFSCHNNGDGARALYLARQKGFSVDAKALEETTKWLTEPGKWHENKGDPGFTDKRLPLVQFGAALAASDARTPEALQLASAMIAKEQDADGSWKIEGQQGTGSPAAYGNELATCMALLVIERANASSQKNTAQARSWILKRKARNVISASSVLLALGTDKSPEAEMKKADARLFLLEAQGSSGGWGPFNQSPPEAFDTAMALLALRSAVDPLEKDAILRGRNFLVKEQEADGGWPATTRPTGGASYAQRISTTAWVLMALLEAGPI
jgi:hypothetical protein